MKRDCFDGFIILKEYKFLEVKDNLKADEFIKEKNSKLLKDCFAHWRNTIHEREIISQHYR